MQVYKINTKSSTKAELVGVTDATDFVMWLNLFIAEQVATVPETFIIKAIGNNMVIQQDSTSSIKLEKNGK